MIAPPRPCFPRLCLAVVGVIVGVLSGCNNNVSDRDIRTIPLADAARLHARAVGQPQAALFIDPRPETAFAEGRIPGARHMTLDRVDPNRGKDPALDRYEALVVYGDNPGSAVARAMTKRLLAVGFKSKKVKFMEGGLEGWRAAGLGVERGAPTAP